MEEEIKGQVEIIKNLSDEIEKGTEENCGTSKTSNNNAAGTNEKKERKSFSQWPVIRWFVNNKSAGILAAKSALLLIIPYAYLFILCWIFDSMKNYRAAGFILYSSIAFWVINIALIVYAVIRFTKHKKG